MVKFIRSVEKLIDEYGGPFIMVDKINAIDFLIWPWFERIVSQVNGIHTDIYQQVKGEDKND